MTQDMKALIIQFAILICIIVAFILGYKVIPEIYEGSRWKYYYVSYSYRDNGDFGLGGGVVMSKDYFHVKDAKYYLEKHNPKFQNIVFQSFSPINKQQYIEWIKSWNSS